MAEQEPDEPDTDTDDVYRRQQMRALQEPPEQDYATAKPAAATTTVPAGSASIAPPKGPKVNPLDLIKQFQGQVGSSNTSTDAIQQIAKKLNESGVAAAIGTHAGGSQGSTDKIVLPDGTYYDIQTDTGWAAPGGNPLHWDPNVNVMDAQGNLVKYADFLKGQGLDVPNFVPTPGDGLPLPGYLGGAGPGNFGTIDAGQQAAYLNNDTLRQIMAELAAIQNGEPSPHARQIQMQQLQQPQNG